MNLARREATPQKRPCKYGINCRSKNPEHLQAFSHPEPERPSRQTYSNQQQGRQDRQDRQRDSWGRDDRSRICKYGETCKYGDSCHYRHPWADGTETPQERQERKAREKEQAEIVLVHDLLGFAKGESWSDVWRLLYDRRDLVNCTANKSYALIHWAAFQKHAGHIMNLVRVFNADTTLKTKEGHSVVDLFQKGILELPTPDEHEAEFDQCVLRFLQALDHQAASPHSPGASIATGDPSGRGRQRHAVFETLEVACPMNENLAGEYVEEEEHYNGRPKYMQKRVSATATLHRIYFSRFPDWGWVINIVTSSGLVLDSRPLAYFGEYARPKPYPCYSGEGWSIFVRQEPFGGNFQRLPSHAAQLIVRPKM